MKVKVAHLHHHPLNESIYTLSDIDDLVQSISELGLLQTLIINDKNQVISGNRRLEAVRRIGWEEVEVEQVSGSPEDESTLIVHFNKQRIKSCKELLNEFGVLLPQYEVGQGKRTDLTNVPENKGGSARDKIADLIGVSSSQIGKLLFIQREDPHYIEMIDDGVLTVSQAYLTLTRVKKEKDGLSRKTNPIASCDDFIFHNKSSDKMTELDDGSVNLIYTSPPYWNKRNYVKDGGLGNEKTPEEYISNLISHLSDCRRVLNDSGSFFLVLGDTFRNGNLLNIPHRVAINLQDEDWMLRNTIVWKKTNPKPSSSKSNLTQSYEFIFHLVKGLGYKYSHTLAPLKHKYEPHMAPRHRDMKPSQKKMYPYIPRNGKNMGDYWSEDVVTSSVATNVPSDGSLEHPAPFPENIITLPILQTTEEGDTVCDPFMGTGTTGRVANQFGRKFVGYDVRVF